MAKKTIRHSPWPWPERPRVLIEDSDPASALAAATVLRDAGYSVAICNGPTRNERCPLVGTDDCTLVLGADLVVSGVGPEIEEALRRRHPGTPVITGAEPQTLLRAVQAVLTEPRATAGTT